MSPAPGAALSYYGQPVTLSVTSGFATAGENAVTVVEVATDAAFTSIVMTKPVAAGTGSASVPLDPLKASTTYYWRVKTTAGGGTGVVSNASRFTIGPQLEIQAPVPVQPSVGSLTHRRPTFTVRNAARTGPAAAVAYTFEVSRDVDFASLVASATVAEAPGETSFTPVVNLEPGATYVWRVRASDPASGVASDWVSQRFSTIDPDDGRFRYDLTIALPPGCDTTRWGSSLFVFDDSLAVNGDHLRFESPSLRGAGESALVVDIQRGATGLTGTIGGHGRSAPAWNTYAFSFFLLKFGSTDPSDIQPANLVGETDNQGRLSGRFDAQLYVGSEIETWINCGDHGFRWTLTPHR